MWKSSWVDFITGIRSLNFFLCVYLHLLTLKDRFFVVTNNSIINMIKI